MSDDKDEPRVAGWEEIKRRRGDRTVHCIVSERYLRYAVASPNTVGDGHPLAVDVMVDRHGQGKDRKLCELILPVEEIEAMVRRAWSDVAAAPENDPRESLHELEPGDADQILNDVASVIAAHGLSLEAFYAVLGIDLRSLAVEDLAHPANRLADLIVEAEEGEGPSLN
jgi:hypothetical protein